MKKLVLVHDAWADSSGWKAVYNTLVKDGHNVTLVQEPETSFQEDAHGRGTVTSVQLAAIRYQTGAPVHIIAPRLEAGQQPEGLAVSPDGRWVATANLETSCLPLTDKGQKFFGSVTLLRINANFGILDRCRLSV